MTYVIAQSCVRNFSSVRYKVSKIVQQPNNVFNFDDRFSIQNIFFREDSRVWAKEPGDSGDKSFLFSSHKKHIQSHNGHKD